MSAFSSSRSWRLLLLLFTFISLTPFALASTPTSFCKCTCFSNSTIIPLDPSKSESSLDHVFHSYERAVNPELEHTDESTKRAQQHRSLSCTDCNRKFCLDYELPTCKGAKEEDVYTTCFQRDSKKDEAVVFIFIFATAGLLTWAACKPWIERYMEAARERRSYMPVAEDRM